VALIGTSTLSPSASGSAQLPESRRFDVPFQLARFPVGWLVGCSISIVKSGM
jgi:hypothetical protein